MNPAVLGIGESVPEHSIRQKEAEVLAHDLCCKTPEEKERLSTIYKRSRVDRRGSVLLNGSNGDSPRQCFFDQKTPAPTTKERMDRYIREATPLALAAVQKALEASRLRPSDISQLITVSCTGFAAPGIDIGIIKKAGFSPRVGRTHIGFMGCHAALNGLRVACAMARQHPENPVLLCAVELCSLHFYCGWDPEKVVANALFADGSAAVAIGGTAAGRTAWRVAANGSCLFPDSEEMMAWTIGDHGFEMNLSIRVPEMISLHLRGWLEGWLEETGLSIDAVRSWAIHPGGPRILSSVGTALQIQPRELSVSEEVLASHGNMSSPTILFILKRLQEKKAPLPCVALAFGPGLAAEAALFV
ncbi:MAG: type III polyketide synthase [Candidatus Omnitrophica bacterium]|nr:type III polyketide synthase [Candidatus Omnitrophota bacterium]